MRTFIFCLLLGIASQAFATDIYIRKDIDSNYKCKIERRGKNYELDCRSMDQWASSDPAYRAEAVRYNAQAAARHALEQMSTRSLRYDSYRFRDHQFYLE